MSLSPANTAENADLVHRAIDLGINYFDTADLYDKGMNETLLGNALKEKRNKIIIATKVGNQWKPDGSGWDWNPRKAYILDAVEASLKRLQTDRIDLYQLHGGTIEDPIDETIEAFEILRQQGKIRYYGISSIRPNVISAYVQRSSIVSVMLQYSLADRRPEETILHLLQEKQIGALSRGALAQGMLVNKPPKAYLAHTGAEMIKASYAVKAISTLGRSQAQTALRFVLDHPAVTAAVVGISRKAQLEEVVAASEKPRLTRTERLQLETSVPAKLYDQHR